MPRQTRSITKVTLGALRPKEGSTVKVFRPEKKPCYLCGRQKTLLLRPNPYGGRSSSTAGPVKGHWTSKSGNGSGRWDRAIQLTGFYGSNAIGRTSSSDQMRETICWMRLF